MLSRGHGRDRWLISYADFVTLLFATFVLMYVAAKKREQHTLSPVSSCVSSHSSGKAAGAGHSGLLTELTNSLSLEQSSRVVSLSSEPRGVLITLDDTTCFQAGQARLQATALPVFEKIGHVLAHYPNQVLLQGHTDSTPIHTSQFRSNWELSTARSIAVMELMQERAGLLPQRFLIAGSADNTPVTENQTDNGRAQNRRVDIIILDGGTRSASLLSEGWMLTN